MNWMLEVVSRPFAITWSFVLLHFVWQGFLIAGVVSLALRWVNLANASLRYGIGCLGLVAMIAFPICTCCFVDSPEPEVGGPTKSVVASAPSPPAPLPQTSWGRGEQVSVVEMVPRKSLWTEVSTIELLRLLLLCIWISAQGLLGGRLLLGALLIWRVRSLATKVRGELLQATSKLARQVGLHMVPQVLETDRITGAMTCGFWQTCVILPSSWIAQMSPEMLEAVIAHELSHVRRYDVWVNFVQRVLETVFFYHPAVWWLSNQIRKEREHCCDVAAVRASGSAGVFARALEFAAQQRVVGEQFALATNLGEDRMSLLNRVQRVLGIYDRKAKRLDAWWIGLVAIVVPLLFVWNESQESIAQEALPSPYYQYDDIQIYPHGPEFVAEKEADSQLVVHPSGEVVENIQRFPEGFEENGSEIQTPPTLDVDAYKIPKALPMAATTTAPINAPNELNKITLPDYVIEPPDVLEIEAVSPDANKPFSTGQYLVSAHGNINLGIHGRVYVAGMTLKAAQAAIEARYARYFKEPTVALKIFQNNSKFYYLIIEDREFGDQVVRLPVTGSETVLDAISQVGGLGQTKCKMWICRPEPKTGEVKKMPVDWNAITRGADTATNYQLLTGDRLFVSQNDGGGVSDSSAGSNKELTDIVERFNRFVRNHDYENAIKCARSIQVTDENRAIAEAMTHHANLLAQTLAEFPDQRKKEIADLLDELRANRLSDVATKQALATSIPVKFDKTPLKTVLAKVGAAIDQDILLNTRALQEYYQITEDEPITIELKKEIPAKSVLHLILDPLGLSYSVSNGIIHVGIPEAYSRNAFRKIHYVGDILGIPHNWRRRVVQKDGRWVKQTSHEEKLNLEQLETLIRSSVSPTLWEPVGGPFDIAKFEANQSLVVNANRAVHEELEELIEQLRGITEYYKKEEAPTNGVWSRELLKDYEQPQILQRFPEGFKSF